MIFSRQAALPLIILVAAILLCAFFSLNFKANSFPDELAHLGYVSDVARQGFPDYAQGVVIGSGASNYLQHPPLYYLLTGAEFSALGGDVLERLVFIRAANWFFLLGFVICILASCRELGLGGQEAAFALLLVVSTPMIPALGGAVSNDPLNFLGCSLFFWGLLRWHFYRSRGWDLMLTGAVVAALTKATGAAVVICLACGYGIVFSREVIFRLRQLSSLDWLKLAAAAGVVLLYFLPVYIAYGEFLPRPGQGPARRFADRNPLAPRRDLIEMVRYFVAGNLDSLRKIYGHVRFYDLPFRGYLFGSALLAAVCCVGIGRYKIGSDDRRTAKLLSSFIIGASFFLTVYFVSTYQRHLATGYPGGVQARYGFGLLPVFAVAAAVGYARISHRWIRWGLLVLAAIPFLCLFYTAFVGDLKSS